MAIKGLLVYQCKTEKDRKISSRLLCELQDLGRLGAFSGGDTCSRLLQFKLQRMCPLFSDIQKELPDRESRINDIRKLKDKFSHIIKFFLMGGEPFLNPDIISYIEETRKILPDTMIQIVTNGLLIPKLSQEVWKAIYENRIVISISEYEPTHSMINRIKDILEEHDVAYILRPYESKTKFIKPLSLIPDSKYEKECISNGCINIWNGQIARCPNLMYINRFNEAFQTALPNQGIYELDSLDGREIIRLMKEAVPLCDIVSIMK